MSEAEDRKDETKADPAVDAQDSDAVMQDEVRDTDINFDCPHCGANQVIDYRGAGLEVRCTSCGEKGAATASDIFSSRAGRVMCFPPPGWVINNFFAGRRG